MFQSFLINSLGFIFLIIIISLIGYFWFFRLRRLIDNYLVVLGQILDSKPKKKHRLFPLYSKIEVIGIYKDRQVVGGIHYVGLGFEWMPLPYIKIKLREVIRYNYHRVPNFAYIDKGWLVLKIKERLPWGVFDKNFNRFFSKDYIVITLTRLSAVADDVERGKTLEDIFK